MENMHTDVRVSRVNKKSCTLADQKEKMKENITIRFLVKNSTQKKQIAQCTGKYKCPSCH